MDNLCNPCLPNYYENNGAEKNEVHENRSNFSERPRIDSRLAPNESPELSTQSRPKNWKIEFFIFRRFSWPTCLNRSIWNRWFLDLGGVQILARISKKSKSGSYMFRRSWKPIVRGSCTVNVTTRSLKYGLPTPSKHTQARYRFFLAKWQNLMAKPTKFQIDRLRQVG